MKKTLCTLLMGLCFTMNANAQVTVAEPQFAEETILLTSDSEGITLKRENASIKTKVGASVFLVGIGKAKSRVTLAGIKSINSTPAPRNARLIIKAKDNDTDPNSFISIFKFELTKKERRYQVAEAGTFTGSKANSAAQVDFSAEKYGNQSYLIQLRDLEPGEYGIMLGDPNTANTKNGLKVTTFTVN